MPEKPKPISRPIDPRNGGTNTAVKPPTHGPDRAPITAKPLATPGGRVIAPTQQNVTVINNNTYVTNITNVQNNWNGRDHGYGWYDWGGYRWCHHYDTYGYHWWGVYIGDYYFWTRYYSDRYWWYDPYWGRWVYLHDDSWWWQDPYDPAVIYLYSFNDHYYYRYNRSPGGVVVVVDPTPPVQAPPAEPAPAPAPDPAPAPNPSPAPAPAPAPQQPTTYYSKDATRMVQIFGDAKEAFLYDTADPPAFNPVWLAKGVDEIRFRFTQVTGADGTQIQQLKEILALTNDGSYLTFAPNGASTTLGQPDTEPVPPPPANPDETGTPAGNVGNLDDSSSFGALSAPGFDGN